MNRQQSTLDRYQRVLITGAQSCGKSTLAFNLALEIGIPAMPEAAREVLEARSLTGGQLFGLAPYEKEKIQQLIFEEHLVRKHALPRVILDRGEIDSYVYSVLLMHADKDCEYWLDWIKARAQVSRNEYDAVFLCPPTIPLVEDGLRESTRYSREVIHLLFKGALDELGYDYYEVTATRPHARVQECLRYLGEKE